MSMTPAEMREMAAKKAEIFTLGMPREGSRRLIAAIRALPIPDTTAADDVLEKALRKIDSKRSDIQGATHFGRARMFLECLDIAGDALAAIDAAKAKGGG